MLPRTRIPALAALVCALALPAAAAADPALLPWPSDAYTKADQTTDTGRRLNLQITQMPTNVAGVPIDPTAFNRNDGFSPGTLIIAKVPGLDTQAAFDLNRFPTNTDPGRSFEKDAKIVVIDATARHHPRQMIWAELEYPPGGDPTVQTLVVHPGKNLTEGHRYIVVLRKLVDGQGNPIGASEPAKPKLLETLSRAGIGPEGIYRTWDFTVASERNLSERMLHIRNVAFDGLGDHNRADLKIDGSSPLWRVYPDRPDGTPLDSAPGQVNVDGITNFTAAQNPRLLRIVRGRVVVPCFLDTPECAPGGTFVYGLDGLPVENPATRALATFVCIVPRSVLTRGPARPSLYGHGLLGDASQVTGGTQQDLANEQNIMLCATDWSGMSTEDLPNVVSILANVSHFDSLVDRGQQGMLNFMYLGRALIHPQGMSTDPAFQVDGHTVVDTSHLYYDGGSQGGIMGGSLTAVAPDFTRAALGVPGMNYSVLLQRSVDFDTYAQVMYNAYPDQLQRPIVLSLIQLLWDRAEANGYAAHITSDPYPDTPPHKVILSMAYGDHQVSNWTTIVEARTIGARLRSPALYPFRQQGDMLYGLKPIEEFPDSHDSELLISDVGPLRQVGTSTKGTPPPPIYNEPNRPGVDPHGPDASEQAWARAQIGAFLQPDSASTLIGVCDDHPCWLDGWDGTP